MPFNPKLTIIVSSDASFYDLGAVLQHQLPDGSERPVMFVSATLSKPEIN